MRRAQPSSVLHGLKLKKVTLLNMRTVMVIDYDGPAPRSQRWSAASKVSLSGLQPRLLVEVRREATI
jgi:hypothetical protein